MQQIGRYEIVRELGRGAMGVVYAAIDPLIGRQVAIKTIRLDSLGDANTRDDLTRRLFREAQSAGILSHPGIITIFDVGERGGDAYIVMEFVAGKTLEDVLAGGVPQPSATLLAVLRLAADALDYAHSKGIVHRDIKPSNIMITDSGTVKIADFGVAKLTASTSLTQAGFVLGTPSYMSPEHAQGREIDGRADQFSLGVVAYRMMTGRLPFDGPTLTAVLSKILWEEPEYESSGLLPSLRPAFEKAFAKDPQQRFALCADFVQELEASYARHKAEQQNKAPVPAAPVKAPQPPPAPPQPMRVMAPVAETAPAEPPAEPPAEAPAEGHSKKWVWVALAAVLVLAAAAFLFTRQSPVPAAVTEEEAAPAPATPVPPPPEKTESLPPANPVVSPKPDAAPKQTPAAPAITKAAAPAKQAAGPVSGTMAWSGNLPKNSILVIEGMRASIGKVEGDLLPGSPVNIEVEPSDVIIRQAPSEMNGWKQIMLYSGPSKCTSISIRWQSQKQ